MNKKNKYYTIFVIEDSDVYRSLLVQELESENEADDSNIRYKVYGFSSGEECMEQLTWKKPDIMIMDYLLNGNGYVNNMNGFELIKSIKKFVPKIDIIILSCQENVSVIKDLMSAGIKKYIKKGNQGQRKVKQVVNELIQIRERNNRLIKLTFAALAFIVLTASLLFFIL